MHLNLSSAKCRPFVVGLNELNVKPIASPHNSLFQDNRNCQGIFLSIPQITMAVEIYTQWQAPVFI